MIENLNVNSSSENQVGQTLKLIVGKTYTINFWAKASTATDFVLQAYMNHYPFSAQNLYRTASIGTDWQEYTYTFSPAVNDDNSVISINMGSHSANYWLDDFSLKPDDLNIIQNPSFEDWSNHWNFTSFNYPYAQGTNSTRNPGRNR